MPVLPGLGVRRAILLVSTPAEFETVRSRDVFRRALAEGRVIHEA